MTTTTRSVCAIAMMATATLAWADVDSIESVFDPPSDPLEVFVWATVPPEVRTSRELAVHVLIRNRRPNEPYALANIVVSDDYLDGFEVTSITPPPDDTDHSSRTLTLYYDLEIAAQKSQELRITLRTLKVGLFSGDLDVWSNSSNECATRRLQTEVVDEPQR